MNMAAGFSSPLSSGGGRRLGVLLMTMLLLAACGPANQAEEEIRKEMQTLKTQIAVMQEKLNQIQAGQQAILDRLPQPAPVAVTPAALAPEILTVAQLLASKDRYLGARVKVKGAVGPVMVHHKSLMLKGPQGMVEVLFGNLADPKLVSTLTATPPDKPLTVTGVVNQAPARGAGAQLQVNAEAVEF
jgi:hypothetical protein